MAGSPPVEADPGPAGRSATTPPRRIGWRRRFVTVMVGWGFYAIAITLVALAARARSRPLVVAACGLLVVVGMAFQRQLGRRSVGWVIRVATATALIVVGVGAIWLWQRGGKTEGWGFLGLTTLFFGSAHLLNVWRHGHWPGPRRGVVVVAVGVAAMVAGLFGFGSGRPGPALTGFLVGLPVTLVGIILLSEDFLHALSARPPTRRMLGLMGLVGLGVVGTAVGGLVRLGTPARYALLIAALLTILVGSLASDNDADVIMVVVALMIAWSLLPRDSAPLRFEPGNGSVLVALGDSFISGEGAKRFYEGTNTKGENQCRRASTAYSTMLVQQDSAQLPDKVLFLACSGAKARHINGKPQYEGEPVTGFLPAGVPDPDGGLTQLGQYDAIAAAGRPDVDLVLLSIGGNDAGFGDLAQTCVGPGDCSQTGQKWLSKLPEVGESVRPAYAEIRRRFATVPVLVVPYPIPLNEEGCSGSLLSPNEHKFLAGFTGQLNAVLRQEAVNAGFHFADTVPGVFERNRLRLCDDDFDKVGVNFFAANPVSGLLEDAISPQNWLHNSLHPNPRGHPKIQEAISEWVGGHQPLGPLAVPANPGTYTVASLENVMGDAGYVHCGSPGRTSRHCHFEDGVLDTSRWTWAHGVDLLRHISLPALGLLSGAWLLWMALIGSWRRARWVRRVNVAVQQRLSA